ncbi:PCMD domain-containing protein [Fibrobacter sp.]|uniref:PCMD domain-containing protein n=1 Tax=Fibrobacter sp. TaxID=35828 RepID=UPI00386E88EF
MKKWIFLALMMVLGACTADYDTFDTSDYRELKDIGVAEQDGSPAIYSEQHRIEFDLVEVPDSLDTWESVILDVLDMSHFATLHLVEDKIKNFPADSAGLDSLAEKVKYSKKTIEQGEIIQIPSSHVLYVVVVSESGKKSIWQLKFNIPDVEPESAEPESSSSAEGKSGKSSSSASTKSSSSEKRGKSSSSESKDTSSSSKKSDNPDSPASETPKILSLSIAGKDAVIDEENKSIHVDDFEFRTDLTDLELTDMELSEGALANVTVGESYDFGMGVQVKVTNEDDESVIYSVKAGYQLPGSNFNSWNKNDVTPDSIWGNANTIVETTKKVTSGSMIGAEIKTASALIKMASGSLYTADFNPNGVGTLSMASSKTWPDGNELLDFGKPFAARPEYMEVKFSYDGKGDSCDIYILLENRTGNKNVNRKSTDVNTLVASAWFRSTKADNSGRENPDVVSVSEPDENGMRTLRLKLKYGEPLEGSPIENSSTFDTTLKSSHKSAINNGLVQGTGEEPVTHIRVVFASSADGNHYEGVEGATLIVDDLKLIY